MAWPIGAARVRVPEKLRAPRRVHEQSADRSADRPPVARIGLGEPAQTAKQIDDLGPDLDRIDGPPLGLPEAMTPLAGAILPGAASGG